MLVRYWSTSFSRKFLTLHLSIHYDSFTSIFHSTTRFISTLPKTFSTPIKRSSPQPIPIQRPAKARATSLKFSSELDKIIPFDGERERESVPQEFLLRGACARPQQHSAGSNRASSGPCGVCGYARSSTRDIVKGDNNAALG